MSDEYVPVGRGAVNVLPAIVFGWGSALMGYGVGAHVEWIALIGAFLYLIGMIPILASVS